MKRRLQPTVDIPRTEGVKGKKRSKISISVDELITVVSNLGNKFKELDADGQWRSANSLWSQLATDLADRLSINNTLGIRKYIYTVWNRKSSKLRSHFIKDELPNDMTANKELPCVPSYTKIRTRSKRTNSSNTIDKTNKPQSHLIELTYEEWHDIYKKDNKSSDGHYMDSSWSEVIYDKLVESKLVTCSLIFKKSNLRKNFSRKRNTSLFTCHARCENYSACTLMVHIKMINPVSVGHNVIFRVHIEGIIRHGNSSVSFGRPLKGKKRIQMAKAAIEHGILKTYENNLLNADDNLLQCNNFTQVPPVAVIKTAVKEQKQGMRLDPEMFTELYMMLLSMRASDNDPEIRIKGFIHVLQLWPFATIFYTEPQLLRFIDYCLSTKDSYIYIDATGSVVKALPDQRKPYLYLICFKDGQDASNLLPLTGALLTDHTAASITNWLLNIRRGIAAAKGDFIRPNYVVIDFSPALLNAILLAFNNMNIQSYLRWCYNVIQKNYTSDQLHFMSCIRFCCAHVMHAFTRSLSKIKINKKIRKKATMIFGLLLNCNEFQQMYEIIGCIVCIFGSPDLKDSEEYLDKVIQAGGDFSSDFETYLEDEDITEAQRLVEEQLAELDDNFLSSQPILHQSPFTKLARERSPALSTIIDKQKKINNIEIKNPMFSKELIKIFYKWIAYLPIFTGLMHQFQERYCSESSHHSNAKKFGSGRVSNAPIESFFKILKHSILRHQTNLRPGEFLLKIHSTTSARLKAGEHNIQQSGSKKRGRSTKKQVDATALTENWKKKGTQIETRGVYFAKFSESTLTATDIRNRLKEKLELRQNQLIDYGNDYGNDDNGDNIACMSTADAPCEECYSLIEAVGSQHIVKSVQESNEDAKWVSPVSHHQTEEINPSDNERMQSGTVSENNINTNECAQATSELSNVDNKIYVQEFDLPIGWPTHTMVGNLRLPFPHYNIGPIFFEGKRYSASNTCSLDSSLFLLYYIYTSNSTEFRSLFDPKILICEQLQKTFKLVETEGWDVARVYWISIHSSSPDRNNRTQHHDLYTTADNNVFQYVRELQKLVIKSKCTSTDCSKVIRVNHSVDIAMPQLNNRSCRTMNMTKFSEESFIVCGVTIGPNEPVSYNGSYIRDDFFPAKDGTKSKTMFICNSKRILEPHQFMSKPPIVLVNVGQVKLDTETNKETVLLVKHLPYILVFGKDRYRLAGTICPQAGHFTATIVRAKGRFSKYDDRCKIGVKNNEGGDDFVETALYTIEMNN